MDDLRQQIQFHERCLYEIMHNIFQVRHSLEAIKAYLIASSSRPDEVREALVAVEEVMPAIDPNGKVFEQLESHLELLKAGKKPHDPSDS